MPPFDFGKQTGRAFQQSFQAAQDRQQQRERQRALQRFRQKRLEHLAEKARKQRQLQRELAREGTIEVNRGDVGFLPGEGTVRMDAGTVARQRRRQQQSTWDMIQSLQQAEQSGNGTIEVQRENVESLPGEGPARVNPNTMIRHGGTGGSQSGAQGGSGGSQGGGTASLPDGVEGTQEEIDRLVGQEQKALDAGVSNDSLASIQDRISRLKQHRDSLRGGAPRPAPAQPDTTQPGMLGLHLRARGDTSRTDTTAAADSTRSLRSTPTSSTDTSTIRGPGRSPGHVSPQKLGMKTSGGNPGGGGGSPSSGGARLRDLGGQPRSTEKLTEEATSLVMEQGSGVVKRRLDSLLEKGRIDRSTRDSVHARALGELMRARWEMGQ